MMNETFIKKTLCVIGLMCVSLVSVAQTVAVTIDGTGGLTNISPWIYGRNNNLSDNSGSPVSSSNWNLYKNAGLRFYRENGGNNATKYNWRAKLSSHPDWYNNVYDHDWDYSAKSLLDNTTNTQGLYAFQLLGYVASNKNNNFNDWNYNHSQWTTAVNNNWAGGGGPTSVGGNGGIGNTSLYLKEWPADSTVAILDHWFNELNYDSTRFKYWNMDNEPEIWGSTHDDVVTSALAAETLLKKYADVAIAVRQKHPNLKLCGPVTPNEWQWYAWNNAKITGTDNVKYTWMEYFIKRISEKQDSTGIRLLDVIDLHFYPGTSSDAATTLQLHHIWYDSLYSFSGANGVKLTGTTSWDASITQEYIFKRCENWLKKYMGADHGVTFAISEYGQIADASNTNPNIVACWYASHLGVFANKGVEFFTPWDWYKGQWEVLSLFSNYYGQLAVNTTSADETNVSAYASLTSDQDSLLVVVVNRNQTAARTVNLKVSNFNTDNGTVSGLQLSGIANNTETYVSKTSNALQKKSYTVSNGQISVSAPSLSVTLVQVPRSSGTTAVNGPQDAGTFINIYPNPASDIITFETGSPTPVHVSLYNLPGQLLLSKEIQDNGTMNISPLVKGCYVVKVQSGQSTVSKKICKE